MLDQYVYVYVLTARVRERNEMMLMKIIADPVRVINRSWSGLIYVVIVIRKDDFNNEQSGFFFK